MRGDRDSSDSGARNKDIRSETALPNSDRHEFSGSRDGYLKMIEGRQLCSFFVQDLFVGIDVEYVQEAVRNMEITHVPLSPAQVFGLINLRSQIITVIDLRRCLDLPERTPEQMPVHLILRTADGLVSLLVDEVGAVIEPDQLTLESSPGALRKRLG